jgi:hypothetical protein
VTGALQLPTPAAAAMIDDVTRYGQLGVETGAMLLASRGSDIVSAVALLGTDGVIRRAGLFVVTMPVIDQLFTFAEDNDLRVRAQLHSHQNQAFLSPTDRNGNIRILGFSAAVVPTFADPPANPDRWGWWTYDGSEWIISAPATLRPHLGARTFTVDAGGIRGH